MSGIISTVVRNAMLDALLGGVPLPSPRESLYVGLSQWYATRGGEVFEPRRMEGYRRVRIGNNLIAFPAAIDALKRLAAPIYFPKPLGDWGTVFSVFIADEPQYGRVLLGANLGRPRTILGGGPAPKIDAGAFEIAFN